MDILQTVMEILIAALAATGFYGILRGLGESFLLPRQITTAVVLREPVDAAALDILLSEAKRHPARRRGQRVVLLVSADLMDGQMGKGNHLHPEYAALTERYDAQVCVAEQDVDTLSK